MRKRIIIAHDEVSGGDKCLKCSVSLYLHAYIVYGSSEGSGESAQSCADSPESSLLDNAKISCWLIFVSHLTNTITKNRQSRQFEHSYCPIFIL